MYKVIYMKADYEPWWQFEGWESNIVSSTIYDTEEQCLLALNDLLAKFRNHYEHEESKEDKYFAFWSDDESEYCEACDDDIQIYHGIIIEIPL